MSPGDNPIPRRVPLAVTPLDWEFEACTDRAPRTATRAYQIRVTGPGRIRLNRFRLRGWGSGYFTLEAPRQPVYIEQGDPPVTITITFRPTRNGRFPARLVFSIIHSRPNGSVLLVSGKVDIVGTARTCAAADEGEGGGGVAPDDGGGGPGGAPPGGGGTPGGGTADGGSPGQEESNDTDEDATGGGASAGSDPPASSTAPQVTVCVRFWKLPGIDPDVSTATLDAWIRDVNRVYRNSGVTFERANRPFAEVSEASADRDPHCLDVYVGGPRLLPGPTNGSTNMGSRDDLEDRLRELGAHERFREHFGGLGRYIQMESGHGEAGADPAEVLAHELGHALGLGPAPDPDAPRQEHLDPTDGQPITHDDRLLNPAPDGTKLTDLERRIIGEMAKWIRGGPRYTGCDKTTKYIAPEPRTRTEVPVGVEARSFADTIEFAAETGSTLPLGSDRLAFALELDTTGSGKADQVIEHIHEGEHWRLCATEPATFVSPALTAPDVIRGLQMADDAEEGVMRPTGLSIVVPKAYFGRADGKIGWRLRLALGKHSAEVVLPRKGWESLDLTPPRFVLDLGEASRDAVAAAGARLTLEGTAAFTPTFGGPVSLALHLTRAEEGSARRVLPMKTIPFPLPETWSVPVDLPEDLEPGRYRMTLVAECAGCGAATSVNGTLVVEERETTHEG